MSDGRPPSFDDAKTDLSGPQIVSAPQRSPSGGDEPYELGDLSVPDYSRPPTAKRRGGGLFAWLLLLLALAAAGLFAWRTYLPLTKELDTTRTARDEALKQVVELQGKLKALEATQAELSVEVTVREQAVASLQRTQEELAQKLEKEIEKGNVLIKQTEGQLVVDLIDKILFDSGEAEVSESGKEVLRQVGETLLKVEDKAIQVAGHTDAMRISPKLLERFPTNWELSTTRATNVVRFLQDEVQVPGERLIAAGFSQYRPAASNASKTGRRKNRRIEVSLVPLPPHAR